MPGPPRKPTKLRVLEGNPGKVKLNRNEPKPPTPTDLRAPAHLDRYARDEWRRIVSQAAVMGYAVTDVGGLEMACDSYSEWRRAKLKCRDRVVRHKGEGGKVSRVPISGLVQESGANGLVPSAWFSIARQAKQSYLRFMSEFGLSPAARTRIETDGPIAPPAPAPAKTGTESKAPGRFFRD